MGLHPVAVENRPGRTDRTAGIDNVAQPAGVARVGRAVNDDLIARPSAGAKVERRRGYDRRFGVHVVAHFDVDHLRFTGRGVDFVNPANVVALVDRIERGTVGRPGELATEVIDALVRQLRHAMLRIGRAIRRVGVTHGGFVHNDLERIVPVGLVVGTEQVAGVLVGQEVAHPVGRAALARVVVELGGGRIADLTQVPGKDILGVVVIVGRRVRRAHLGVPAVDDVGQRSGSV